MNHQTDQLVLNVIPISDIILLPGMEYTLAYKGESLQTLLHDNEEQAIVLAFKRSSKHTSPEADDFYRVGTLVKLLGKLKQEQHHLLKIKVLERVEVTSLSIDDGTVRAEYTLAPDDVDLDLKSREEMLNYIKRLIHEIGSHFKGSEPFVKAFDDEQDLNLLMGHVGQYLHISAAEKQALIETRSLKERSLQFMDHLLKQKESIKLQIEMAEKMSEKANKAHRENILREQLKNIQDELKESAPEGKDYRRLIEEAGMPPEVLKVALAEVDKYESQSPTVLITM